MEPRLDAKVARHFRHAGPHRFLINAQIFQTKRKFMPDFICHDLAVRILHYIADLRRLRAQIHFLQWFPVKQNLAGPFSIRCQNGFQLV